MPFSLNNSYSNEKGNYKIRKYFFFLDVFIHLEKKELNSLKTKKIGIIYLLENVIPPIRFSFHSVTVTQMKKKKSIGLIL